MAPAYRTLRLSSTTYQHPCWTSDVQHGCWKFLRERGGELDEAGKEGLARGGHVLRLSLPDLECLVLERAGEAEGEWPRCLLFMRESCNRREVLRCLIRRLSAGEEQDTGDLLRHALRERCKRRLGDLLGRVFARAIVPATRHRSLKEESGNIDRMLGEDREQRSKRLFDDRLRARARMSAREQDFRLKDGYEARGLRLLRIVRDPFCVLVDCGA